MHYAFPTAGSIKLKVESVVHSRLLDLKIHLLQTGPNAWIFVERTNY